jgi:hypothetical protein
MGGFIESENAIANSLAVYKLAGQTTSPQFDGRCQGFPPVLSVALLSGGGSKSGFVSFGSSSAHSRFAADGRRRAARRAACKRAPPRNAPPAHGRAAARVGRRVVFPKHLPPAANGELSDALSRWGDVVAAFQGAVPQSGARAAGGVTLFGRTQERSCAQQPQGR